jgi:hypothetical protein
LGWPKKMALFDGILAFDGEQTTTNKNPTVVV